MDKCEYWFKKKKKMAVISPFFATSKQVKTDRVDKPLWYWTKTEIRPQRTGLAIFLI